MPTHPISSRTVRSLSGAMLLLSVLTISQLSPLSHAQTATAPPPLAKPAVAVPSAPLVGSQLPLRFLTTLDSRSAQVGDSFLAEVAQDIWRGNTLILPQGMTVRGRVVSVERPKLLNKNSQVKLAFEHVSLPNGDIAPLGLVLDTQQAGSALYGEQTLDTKLGNSVDKGVAEYKSIQQNGLKASANPNSVGNTLLKVPNAIGGVIAGVAVTGYEGSKSLFGKGQALMIQPGDTFWFDVSQGTLSPAR